VANLTLINGLAVRSDGLGFALATGLHKVGHHHEETEPEYPVRLFLKEGWKLQLYNLKGHEQAVHTVVFSPDNRLLASGSGDATVKLWDVATRKLLTTLAGHTADVGSVAFSHDGRFLASAGYDQTVCLWDVKGRKLAAVFVAFDRDDFIMLTPDNYYTASRQGLKRVAFRLGNRAVPFEQFDVRLNRPDLVLERLPYASPELVRSYRRARQKRLQRLKVREDALGADYQLPRLELLAALPVSTTARRLTVRLRAADAHTRLERLLAFVNDVPVWGTAGADLRPLAASGVELEVPIDLSAGANKGQLAVRNARGAESLQETFEITYQAPPRKPDLYVVAVGVSRYRDQRLDLEYAAKDAQDVAAFFARRGSRFGAVKVLTALDQKATRENIRAAKRFLGKSTVDDQAVVFLAGHGFLDDRGGYYFGTADVDVKEPGRRGLAYEEVEDLLDGIPARRKLLLMDTCHSGELDPDDARPRGPKPAAPLAAQVRRGWSGRGLEVLEADEKRLGPAEAHGLLGELFADLRRGSGAMVIASAGGAEFAFESPRWKNGVFTYALLEGLGDRKADLNKDGEVRVSELRDYVVRRVQELTGGRQTPTARRENLEVDFPVD
jgi:hypothetical protein